MSSARPLLVRVDPVRLARAMGRVQVSWLRLLLTVGLKHPTRRHLAAGEPLPLRLVYALAQVLDVGADDLLADTAGPP